MPRSNWSTDYMARTKIKLSAKNEMTHYSNRRNTCKLWGFEDKLFLVLTRKSETGSGKCSYPTDTWVTCHELVHDRHKQNALTSVKSQATKSSENAKPKQRNDVTKGKMMHAVKEQKRRRISLESVARVSAFTA